MASEEDQNESRRYIAREQTTVHHLRETVANHEAHIDNLDAKLIDARADLNNYREMYNAVEPDVNNLQNALVLADNMMVDYRHKMEDALKAQRDESRR
eukprot:14782515-Heterocapsa_arctica.AAC.1